MNSMRGKTAFITGAARGMGLAVARRFALDGASVVLGDVAPDVTDTARGLTDSSGQRAPAVGIRLDITEYESVLSAMETARREFGPIDILVNAAGVGRSGTIAELTPDDWDFVMNVNAKGTFLCCKAVVAEMGARGWGRIINFASQAGKTGEAANGPYCASKAAVILFTESLALETAAAGITVNSICPGLVDTEMIKGEIETRSRSLGMTPDQFRAKWLARVPIGRLAEPVEVAALVSFLASEEAGYITGAHIDITGARHIS